MNQPLLQKLQQHLENPDICRVGKTSKRFGSHTGFSLIYSALTLSRGGPRDIWIDPAVVSFR